MHDPNAGIGGSYAFTWRGFAALVPKRDYDEVHRYLRRRSKRERLKMGEVAMAAAAAAFDAVRNGTATKEQHQDCVCDVALMHASGLRPSAAPSPRPTDPPTRTPATELHPVAASEAGGRIRTRQP